MDTAITTSLIAAGSALGGVLVKMAYDATIEKIHTKKENWQRFIDERKAVYDEFLRLNKEEFRYRGELQKIALIARAGRQVRPEVLEQFPDSPMSDLVETLEKIRRIARTYEVVQIAERVIRLHGDAATALRFFVQSDSITYGLPLFLANRLGGDQVLEFIAAYRRDLLIGPPKGASGNFPIIDRGMPVSISEAEQNLRIHLRNEPAAARDSESFSPATSPKVLTEKDAQLLEKPQYRSLILEEDPPQ